MITNPFQSLGFIFSEISQKNQISALWNSESDTKDKIATLSKEIIAILKHPRDKGLKASDLFTLKNRIADLRHSSLGKNNYANCEKAIRKIEKAIDKFGKNILIGHATINTCFQNEVETRIALNYLIDIFKESYNEKVPLSLVYKLQNLSILSFPKALSKFVNMLHKAPEKLDYFNLISKHIFMDGLNDAGIYTPLLGFLYKQEDGGFTLLKAATPIFEFLKLTEEPIDMIGIPSSFSFNTNPAIHKLFVLKVISLFLEPNQEVDKEVFLPLFSGKSLNKSEGDLLLTLTRIPKKNRMPALLHAAKFFSSDLGLWEKFTYILEVSLSPENNGDPLKIATLFKNLKITDYFTAIENIPLLPLDNDFRRELIEDAMEIHHLARPQLHPSLMEFEQFFYEQENNSQVCKILNILFKMETSRDKRATRLLEIKKIFPYFANGINGKEIARSLVTLSQNSDDPDMRDAMQSIHRLFNAGIIDAPEANFLFQPFSLISSIPLDERDDFVDQVIEAFKYLDFYLGNRNFLIFMRLLSPEEKSFLMSNLLDAATIFEHFSSHLSNHFTLEFSLFLSGISVNEDLLQKLKAGELYLSKEQYIEHILSGADKKLSHVESIPKEALMVLCHYLYNNQRHFHLFEQHPLIQKTIELLSLENLRGLKNPFLLHKKLIDLSKQPVNFQPSPTTIEGKTVCFNMKAFEEMSLSAKIERKDVPEEATVEAFDTLFSRLNNKYNHSPNEFQAALTELNPDLSWIALSQITTLNTLRGLLTLTGEDVNPNESKWRKVLAHLLTKSTENQNGSFFTEQERVQITTQYIIQACPIGIGGGIEDAYQSLPSSFKYKGNPLPLRTNSDLLLESRQKSALEFLSDWTSRIPDGSIDDLSLLLMKEDSKTLVTLLPSLIGHDQKLWDVTSKNPEYSDDPLDDPFAEWNLTLEGAKAALHAAFKTKEKVRKILVPLLHEFIEGLFNRGNDAVIKHFIGDIEIKQTIHQSRYIQNLIGHAAGLSKYISPDQHAALIYEELTSASVNEVLEVFFEKHPPEDFVKEVIRVINQNPEEYRKALPSYFNRPEFWDSDNNLTLQGALELLIQSGFLEEK